MPDFENDSPEERLLHEAEELMRQRRFSDAVSRYQNLRRFSPTDLFASLGHASALELAGRINEAEQVLEEATVRHRRSAPLHRFRHLFFERREDFPRAQSSARALHSEVMEDGPEDQLADLYFNQGRYHEARAELERLLRESRLDEAELRATVLARIGACLRQSGDHDTARERLLEALALDSGYHWARSELAEVERALGNSEAARRRYTETLAAQPDDHWCRGHLAQLEYEDGNHARAAELYRDILTRAPKAVWAKVELAQVLADKDMAEAVRLCRSAIDDDPTYPMAHAQLGNLARREGRYDEAREHYRQALSTAPNNTWVLHELAEICRHLGRLEEAYAHLEHARNLEPYEATTYGYFADLLRHEGKHAAAVQHLEKAVELDDSYAWAWRELAELRALDGRHEAAEAAYRKACELESDEAINDGLKAFLLRCAGRREAALPYLERAVEKQADYLWAWREQVEHHLSRHQAAQAEACARRGLAALPESPSLHGLLAEALRRQGRRGEAREPLAKALALAPSSAQLHALDAELRVEDGDLAGAGAAVQRAIASEDAPEYRALHAQILIASDRHGEAETVVRGLITTDKPIAPAFELAAALAEHAGDLPGAIRWCDRALAGPHANDLRLTVRRARLGQAAGEADAGDRLLPLLDQGGPLPWRDIAQILAQAGRGVLARRAAYQYIAALPPAAEERARGWLHLAELELGLGNLAESQQALDRTLALDADCVPGQILGAVLADQRGDLPGAIGFLEGIDRRLHERDPAAADDEPTESALLLRQLASLYERARRHDDAGRCWARIIAEAGDQPGYRCDHAAWLLRQGRFDEGRAAAETALAAAPPDLTESQRLLRELAITTTNRQGAKAGVAALAAWRDRLATANRLLFAQLALTAGDYALARGQLDQVLADPAGDHRAARLLGVRQRLATHDFAGAEREAGALAAADADDEEAAALHGEALALQRRFAEALSALTADRLPARPSLERGLLIAMVRGEHDGEAALLAALGRVLPTDHASPLARLFATAWPTAWAAGGQAVAAEDVLCLPPFPRLAGIIAAALAARGRRDLATTLALSVANAVGGDPARRLRRAAIPWLVRLGRRGLALRVAWALRSPGALIRALF